MEKFGDLLKVVGFELDFVFIFVFMWVIKMLNFIFEGLDCLWVLVEKFWCLNECYYGGLVGLNKDEIWVKYGEE